tara:strand:+ start:609 stop:1379 length:771 start_codon:yes stop_codon:yes gene_type:complete
MSIHSKAIVDPKAKIGNNVTIGAYSIIDKNVSIGNNTIVKEHVVVRGNSVIGDNCTIFQGAIIGEIPQDLKFENEHSVLTIGNNTTIREYVTLNRGTKDRGETNIGSNVLLMAYVHIGHDSEIKDNVIIANSVQVGGHVTVENNAIIGGSTPIHQFCKVGRFSIIGGGLRIVQDVPPYIMAAGEPLKYIGINSIGLRRSNFSVEIRKQLKFAYKYIYNSGINTKEAIKKIKTNLDSVEEINNIVEFIKNSNRGIIS